MPSAATEGEQGWLGFTDSSGPIGCVSAAWLNGLDPFIGNGCCTFERPPILFNYLRHDGVMSGINWTYSDLCEAVPYLNQSSSTPSSPADLNPLIRKILRHIPSSSIWAIGGHSVVIYISDYIMAKVSLSSGSRHLDLEQRIFELLEETTCPYIVKTYLRRPDITYMQPLRYGALHERMANNAPPPSVLDWMLRIATAASCLEKHGYAHGDINPRNILFDHEDQPYLVDFDHAVRIGEPLDVGYEPYVRCSQEQAGGQYGVAGPITEQLALGSIFWFMVNGKEMYQEVDGPEKVDRLMTEQFPDTHDYGEIGKIITECWLGQHESLAHLSQRISDLKKLAEDKEDMSNQARYLQDENTLHEVFHIRRQESEEYHKVLEE